MNSYESDEYNLNKGLYELPRNDKYDYYHFSLEQDPDAALLTRQIQAQSYVTMKIVRPEGTMILADGAQVLSPNVSSPSGSVYDPPESSYTEYVLGVEKGTVDRNPETGHLVAWKKLYAPLEDLPTYHFCKDYLWPEGEEFLRSIEADPSRVLVEPEALSKTNGAGGGAVKEFIRAEIQHAFGRGEVWFMGLVESTAFESFIHNWGPTAVRQIGASRRIDHPHMHENVALVPTVIDVDGFFDSMANDIFTLGNRSVERLLRNFIYMTEGMSDAMLGSPLAEFRYWAIEIVKDLEGDE